jgi:hypothetical protein
VMGFFPNALRLSQWALEAMILDPLGFTFILAGVSLFLAWRQQRPFLNGLWKPCYWLVLTQLLFFLAIIAVGVLYAAQLDGPPSTRHPNETGTFALEC